MNDRSKFRFAKIERESGGAIGGAGTGMFRGGITYDIWLGPDLPLTLASVGMDQGIAFLAVSQLQARIKNQSLENPQSPSYGSTAGENDLKA
ncbi:hypothetical protein NEUTE1DRAFT_141640 [Neurospora tetrasperma FGSC 2508]|uniref:Uncharacterized protein n=1 Tax=Neurospora tetrasperma (strain FGSC 2508 / ATCC MYA-4615 / P0657) TaxID=510951 RepID=F8N3A9_NEUT8|nr:uncharacterized protein NEUTE1DRAFT_141640 [Neurospora tetrasperma FGSC 2508]EGO51716.1 hypothetical protein NEUTE1DRAFT_141640 [Neurospora tetrasperma FGSC 2508]